MLAFVIACNLLLTFLNLYLALRLWRLRRELIQLTQQLSRLERRLHFLFTTAPEIIYQGEQNTHHLSQQYQQITRQIKQLRQLLLVMSLLHRIWQRHAPKI